MPMELQTLATFDFAYTITDFGITSLYSSMNGIWVFLQETINFTYLYSHGYAEPLILHQALCADYPNYFVMLTYIIAYHFYIDVYMPEF